MFGRWSGSRATTLLEVMIASTLFIVVSAALFFTLRSSQNHLKPMDQKSQDLRACLLSVDVLSQELSSAWVTEPQSGVEAPELRYRVPLRDADGTALTGPTGDLLWSPPRVVNLQSGKMMRSQGAELRILSNLGTDGSVQFLRASPTLLEITVRSSHGNGFELKRSFQLINQF